jgi:hypothetical protein
MRKSLVESQDERSRVRERRFSLRLDEGGMSGNMS